MGGGEDAGELRSDRVFSPKLRQLEQRKHRENFWKAGEEKGGFQDKKL